MADAAAIQREIDSLPQPFPDCDEPLRPATGILVGVLISTVLWLIIGAVVAIWLTLGTSR